jgi:hypothetical protein
MTKDEIKRQLDSLTIPKNSCHRTNAVWRKSPPVCSCEFYRYIDPKCHWHGDKP